MFLSKAISKLLALLLLILLCVPLTATMAQDDDATVETIFSLESPDVVVPRANWQFTDPGGAVYHDGQFHMFPNAFNGWPALSFTYHSVSDDALNWELADSRYVFGKRDVPYAEYSALASSALVEEDGTWVLYYYTLDNDLAVYSGAIGRATADDPNGPWVSDDAPVLDAGSAESWDSFHVSHPSVVRTEDGYVMYYTGRTEDAIGIGMATSEDGINWVKYDDPTTTDAPYAESDPIMTTLNIDGATRFAMQPQVQLTPDGWVMILRAATGYLSTMMELQLAVSEDGIDWIVYDTPAITNQGTGGAVVWFAELVYAEDMYYLFFEVSKFDPVAGNTTEVYLATYEGALPAP